MATTEHTINDAIAALLRETRRVWSSSDVVSSENTGMLKGSNRRPDILVIEPNVSPVVIETEVLPAISVEVDATERLGESLRTTGRTILSSIAVRLPSRFRKKSGAALRAELSSATDIEIAVFTGTSASEFTRWPERGWINGSIADLSTLSQSASVPPEVVDQAATKLVDGVTEAAALLEEVAESNPNAIHKISVELRQEDGEQTRRMAMTILANAFVFHESLAGGPGKLAAVNTIEEVRNGKDGLTKASILAEWRKILIVNYWPIFDIARRILEVIPATPSGLLIERLASTADALLKNRLMRSHDLTGAVFQRLIADRKFLAAYYTTPSSAALLTDLAITPECSPAGGSWADAKNIKNLRIADFACGTGTLLSTAYQRVGQLHELAGGDSEALHPYMMARALVGCDVLPAATHLTASMLAGAHPTVKYNQSSILTVSYGKQKNGEIALGSLDLLDSRFRMEFINITAKTVEGMGTAEKDTWAALPHDSFDVVIMNPPFTRATGHEGSKIGVPNPMFAAFDSSKEEQRLMGLATQQLVEGTSAHGNAGEASMFLVLADYKVRMAGMLAMVMPLSLMSGEAWENSRVMLAKQYKDLILVSIAGSHDAEMSFSADTYMGECLLVGRKAEGGSKRATFVILNERPASPLHGASTAQQIRQLIASKRLQRLEDGPLGGTQITFGDDHIGEMIDAPLPKSGIWNLSRISDLALAQTAYQLEHKNRIWLPTMTETEAVAIPITNVAAFGEIGPYHMDINGTAAKGIRGPFKITLLKKKSTPTYPVLWSHSAEHEKTMCFGADSEGIPLIGANQTEQDIIKMKVAAIWSSASHCHFNRDFRFNSQATAMQFTRRKTIGGRAWLSIKLSSEDKEKVLVVWANTSLGLLLYWWHANKQQAGRGSIGKAALASLPVLDVSALTMKQLERAVKLFDDMADRTFLPLHRMDDDPVREELDQRFASEVLGLPTAMSALDGPLDILRRKLAQEPSIRGSKG